MNNAEDSVHGNVEVHSEEDITIADDYVFEEEHQVLVRKTLNCLNWGICIETKPLIKPSSHKLLPMYSNGDAIHRLTLYA